MSPSTRRFPVVPVALAASLLAAGCGRGEPGPSASPPGAQTPSSTVSSPSAIAVEPGGAGEGCRDAGTGPEPDAGGLRAFVKKRATQLRDCYQRALKRDAAVGGKATFRFTIGTCGELSAVQIAGKRGKVDDAAACVAGAMRGWHTPFRPAEPVTVEYPISFSATM